MAGPHCVPSLSALVTAMIDVARVVEEDAAEGTGMALVLAVASVVLKLLTLNEEDDFVLPKVTDVFEFVVSEPRLDDVATAGSVEVVSSAGSLSGLVVVILWDGTEVMRENNDEVVGVGAGESCCYEDDPKRVNIRIRNALRYLHNEEKGKPRKIQGGITELAAQQQDPRVPCAVKVRNATSNANSAQAVTEWIMMEGSRDGRFLTK
ncbi:hypothetical protein B0A55_10695 [Friedmanniomyces simplex]|uniref:Uncharacterized protein n=1 Tax=Friedmanniomyces simplex TaxID=329884 RepID=A0A4U0WKS2_9PEZI|nr:hypothetical protein B0A55_10695 [Friedmanniomyces simplex]